jgi:hypothetical protein
MDEKQDEKYFIQKMGKIIKNVFVPVLLFRAADHLCLRVTMNKNRIALHKTPVRNFCSMLP